MTAFHYNVASDNRFYTCLSTIICYFREKRKRCVYIHINLRKTYAALLVCRTANIKRPIPPNSKSTSMVEKSAILIIKVRVVVNSEDVIE